MLKLNSDRVVVACLFTAVVLNCTGQKANIPEQKNASNSLSAKVQEKQDSASTDSSLTRFDISVEGYKATSLGQAVYAGDTSKVQSLIKQGASIENCLTDETYNYDILYAALVFNKVEIARYVLRNKLYSSVNKTYTEESETPLTLACAFSNAAEALEIAESLIVSGANVNGSGESGGEYTEYPLINAVNHDNPGLAKLLIDHGASKDIKNKDGDTPLKIAEKKGSQDLINLLKSN